jgi:hypothetical protein
MSPLPARARITQAEDKLADVHSGRPASAVYIHVTDNYVPRRGAVFLASLIVLALMWAIFIIRILLGLG